MSAYRIANQQPVRLKTTPSAAAVRLDTAESLNESDQFGVEAQPLRGRLLRLELFVIASIICFGYFAWRTRGQERVFQEAVSTQGETVAKLANAISRQNEMVANVHKSVQEVTKTLTMQIGGLSNDLQTRRNQMDIIQSRLRGVEVTLGNRQQAQQSVQSQVNRPSAAPSPASWAASPQHPHQHMADTSLPMPDNAVAHHTTQGETDYWLVLRVFSDEQRMVKVVPYGMNSLGVKVHNMENGVDYILTPAGQWTAALEQQ